MITESIKKILKENSDNDAITLEWESHDIDWNIPVDFKCNLYPDGYAETTCSLYNHREVLPFYIKFPLYDKKGNLKKEKIEKFVETKWDEYNCSI